MKHLKHLLALCILICIAFTVTACAHKHSFGTDWAKDGNNHWHVCDDNSCQEISDKAAHTFGEGFVKVPATEEAEGIMAYICTVCGLEKLEMIKKLEPSVDPIDPVEPEKHTHELSKVDELAPTCVEAGEKEYYVCNGCDAIFSDAEGNNEISAPEIIPATGHSPVEYGELKDPTCTTVGSSLGIYCSVCEEILSIQQITPALGHSWDDGKVTLEPTCGAEGVKTFTCTTCGDTQNESIPTNEDAHVWVDGTVISQPTCSTEGERKLVCSVCDAIKNAPVAINPDAHSWVDGDIITNPTCSLEGVREIVCSHNSEHKSTALVAINPNAHDWDEGSVTTAPQCVEEGVKTYCCIHNSAHQYTEAVAALGHDIVVDNPVASDCVNDGLTEGSHCSRCDGATVAQKPVPATGHTYDNADDRICNSCGFERNCTHDGTSRETIKGYEASCTEEGLSDGEKCLACGEIITPQVSIPAAGHKNVIDKAVDPTCTESGLTAGEHCSACGVVFVEQQTVPAKGHSASDAVKENEVAPDCITAGSYDNVVYCSVCNAEMSRVSTSVDALGHTEYIVPGTKATCSTEGLSDGISCSTCGIAISEQVVVDARPHAWNNPVITVDGVVGTVIYTCKNCNAVDQYTGPVNNDDAHVCDHLVNGVETEYGKWTACSVCGAKSYAVTALSAYKGSGATHASVDVYVLKEGQHDTTKKENMVASGTKVSDVAVTYNITSGADKNSQYVEFTYKVNASEAITINVYFNGRSTNIFNNINQAAQINKFMRFYQNGNEIAIPDSAVLPAYVEGCPYWTEEQIATVDLEAGENTFTFRFTKEGGIYNKGKYYGAYASYFRFAEASKAEESCSNNYHNLELVYGSSVSCTQDGVQMHYACTNCNKIFDYYNKVEVKYENLIIPAYDEHIYDSTPHPQTDANGNPYYAYFCVRGCGAQQIHTCTNDGKHLIIAREPNLVWYEDGDSFNPDRMEVYLSNCAEGCGDNTLVAGHLVGYSALTYTYQNGDSFKAGDEYITINYTLEGATYSANLPVTVTAVGKTITVDDSSENFSYINVAYIEGDHKHSPGSRTNDQGKVGQSAYGGTYTNNFTDGDIAKFTFILDEAGSANIVLRAATDRITGNIKYAFETIASEMMVIYIDGQVVNLDESVVFEGSVANIDPDSNRWTWTVWSNIDLGTFNLGEGEHTVEIVYNNISDYKSAEGYNAHVQLDCLNVFLAD